MLRERLFAIAPAALLILPLLIVAFTLTQAAVARAMGVGIVHLSLGVGPEVAVFGRLRLHALPLGAHIQLALDGDEAVGRGLPYDTLPVWKKLLLMLSGPAALAAMSPLLSALHPDLGWLCGALAVVNLLPLPSLSGGQSLIALAEAATGAPLPVGLIAAWSLTGAVALLVLLGWLLLG